MEDFDEPMSPVLMDKKWVFNEGKRATTANDEQKHNLLLQPTEAQKETGLLSEVLVMQHKALDSNQRYKHSEVTPVNSSSAICKIKNKNPELNPSPDMKVRSQFSEGKTVLSLDEQTPTSSRNSFSRNISLLDLDDSVEKNFLSKCRDLTNNFQSGSPHIQKYSVKQLENDKHSIFKPSNKFESSILNNSNEEYFLTSSGYKPSSSVKLDSPVGFSPTKRTLEVNVCTKFQANEKTESNTEDNTVSTNDKRHFPDMIFEEDNHLQDSNREDEKEEIINKSRNLFLSEVYESPVNSSQLVYTKKESPEKHSEKNDQYMKTSAEVEQISNPAFLTLGGTVVNMSQNCTKTMSEDINDESDFIDVEGVDSSDEPDGYLKERLKLVKEINADEDNYPTCSSDLNPVTRRFSSVNDKSCRNSTCKDNLKNNRDTALKDHFIDFNLAAFSQADISLETYSSESGKVLNPLQVCRNTSSMTSDDFSGSDVSQVPSEFIETEIVMPESEGSEGYSRLPDLTLIARDKENDEGEITIVESMISDDPVDSWSLNLEDSSKTEMGASSTTGGILKNQNKEINNFSQFAKNNMQFCAREENSVHFSKCIDKQDRLSSKFVEHSNDIQIESSEERFTFSTAGGKSVEISESRLARARKLFAEDFDDGKEIDSISTLETGKFKQISADSSDKMNLLFSHQIPEEQVSFSNGSGINVTISQRRDEARDEKRKKIYVEDNGKNNQISTSSENNEVLEKSFKISEKSSQEIEDLNKKHSTVDNNGLSTRILASSEMDKPEKLQIYKEETLDATSEKNGLIGENKVFAQDSDKETKNIIPGIYFSTALGKEVKSESSLVKAKNLCELDLEENFKLLASAESSVFSTASGKEIKLSEKSLAKAKKLFGQDLDENLKLSIPPESSVFSTASGKEIKLSEKSLAKAKKLFGQDLDENLKLSIPPESSVFSTASGKEIKLSEKSLAKAKKLFGQDLDENLKLSIPPESSVFSTASGKEIKLSEKSLAKAKKLFGQDLDENLKLSIPPESSVFSTASGKEIKLSEKSLAKAKKLFGQDLDENLKLSIPPESSVFPTASGKEIKLSEKSLAKAKKLFEQDLDENLKLSIPPESSVFSTATGKEIKLSEKSLAKAKKLFGQDLDENLKLSIPPESSVFSTASGKEIKLSEKSLAKAKKLFEQDLDENLKLSIPPESSVFSTASGKEIKLSEKSLAKAKKLFGQDLDENLKLSIPPESSVFSTASGKEIKLSEKSLAKAKKLFEQDLDENLKLSIPPESSVFSTATGKEIKLSEKSLAKAKKLFGQDLDENLETSQLLTAGSPLCSPQKGPLCSKKSDDNCATSTTEILYSVASTKEGYSLKGNNQTQETSSSLGFSTASGKQIFVSEKSLVKAMKLFTEEMNDCSASSVIKELRGSIRKPFSGLENKSTSMGTAHLAINNVDKTGCEKVEQNVQKCEAGDKTVENPDVDLEPGFFHEFSKHVFPQESCFSTGSHTKKSCVYNSFSAQEKSNKISYKTAAERKEYLPSDSKIKNTENEKNVELDADLDKELSECNIIKSNKRKLIHDENTPISNSNFNYKRSLVRNNIEKLPSKMNIAKRFEIGTPERTIGIEKKAKISEKEVKFCDDIPVGPLKYENKLPRLISTNSNDNNSTVKVETEIELLGAKKCQLTSSQMSEVSECTLAFMELADEFGVDNAGNTTNDTTLAKRKSTEQETWDSKICKKLKYEHDNHDSEIEKRFRAYSDAKKRQVETIEMKKKCKVKPQTGSLFLSKEKQERKQLSDALGENIARLYTREELLTVGVNNDILDLTSLNAHEFRFNVQRFCEGEYEIQMDDGIILVPDLNNEMGLTEIKDCFLASPGVDPSLVPVNWVENHYRWIVWKLCSFERTFPKQFSGRCLNVENVLLQLKYRYDKEIDKAQRPALRKILERDEQPGRTFICCVASIKKTDFDKEGHRLELEITDGWYSVFTLVDPEMVELVRSNKVKIGTKLIVHGAELLNCDDGCDPLNVPQEVKLQIHTNSVRRVRWYSKMGFFRNPGPIVVGLNSILPNGGLIGLTTGVVARVYPLLFMSKDTEGKTVLRNDRMQSIEEAKQNELCGKKVEAIYENVWKEVEEKYVPKSLAKEVNLKNIKNIDDPKSLYAIYKMTADESLFSPEQLTTVTAHHEEVTAKIRSEVDESVKKQLGGEQQNIKRMKKVKIVDYFTGCPFCLTIWQPTEEVLALIDECKTLDLYGLSASGVRDNMIQLSTTRQTRFVENNCLQSVSKYKRKITKLSEFASDNFSPLFGEVEVIGVVIYVTKPDQTHGVTKVYLSDLESNYLAITFWSSLSKFGWEEILEEGSLVAGSNLQWRIGSRSSTIPCVYATEMSLFSQNPKQLYFKQEITEFNLFSIEKSLTEFAEDEKMKLLNIIKHPESTLQSPSTVHLNLSNLKSPSALCQKRARLSNQYGGQVLPLSPMALANNHPNVRKEFISPFRTKK